MSSSQKLESNFKFGDDDDKLPKEFFKEVHKVVENAVFSELILEDEVKQSLCDVKSEDEFGNPFYDNEENPMPTQFKGEYEDTEYILEFDEDELNLAEPRRKKSKTCTEFKAPSGRVWSVNRTAAIDSVAQLQPLGKGPATKIKNALEAWCLLLDERILTIITSNTNEEIRKRKGKSSFEKTTDIVELRAWMGLNYLCGIFRNTTQPGPLSELWTLELGNSIFRGTMTLKRFEFLTNCLRFSTPVARKGCLKNYLDIQDVWERFLANCRSYYSPSGNCAVHENFIEMNDSNSSIQLTILSDSKSLYLCNALISNRMTSKKSQERAVLHLVTDLKGSQRNIVLPEEYTNTNLVSELKQRNLTVIGCLGSTSEEVPVAILVNKASQKLYSDIGCLRRLGSDNESFLLSSEFSGNVAVETLFELSTRSCQNFKQAVELFSTSYSANSDLYVWSLNLFYRIMNFAALNAWVLMRLSRSSTEKQPTQREFQRNLGLYLTQLQLKRQLQDKSKLTLPQKLQISEVLGEPTQKLLVNACEEVKKSSAKGIVPLKKLNLPDGLVLMSKTLERRKRCAICTKYQTRSRCQQCLRALCYRHLIARCNDCMGFTDLAET
ncbi:uncharacterized protein LOC101451606 isoform X2 [Ceratitis capitata]|uniref:PiggyBac transposable element-derived protein 4 n=1 Tax=Ceratitis capitata TaxID=7213 RepID=W8B2V6_CERCA|nr:uncharacterized protein LOC101451606 isoform X2 [Ceratitis capitata]